MFIKSRENRILAAAYKFALESGIEKIREELNSDVSPREVTETLSEHARAAERRAVFYED